MSISKVLLGHHAMSPTDLIEASSEELDRFAHSSRQFSALTSRVEGERISNRSPHSVGFTD